MGMHIKYLYIWFMCLSVCFSIKKLRFYVYLKIFDFTMFCTVYMFAPAGQIYLFNLKK